MVLKIIVMTKKIKKVIENSLRLLLKYTIYLMLRYKSLNIEWTPKQYLRDLSVSLFESSFRYVHLSCRIYKFAYIKWYIPCYLRIRYKCQWYQVFILIQTITAFIAFISMRYKFHCLNKFPNEIEFLIFI